MNDIDDNDRSLGSKYCSTKPNYLKVKFMKNKKTLSMLALGLLLGGGAIGATQVLAKNQPTNNNADVVQQTQTQEIADQANTNSAIEPSEDKNSVSEQAEDKNLSGLAKISASEAQKIAETKVSGTASKTELENENGQPVYAVTIGTQEVKVDAISGSVLRTESADDKSEASDKTEEKGGSDEKDGIDHQFEGEENNAD